MAVVALAQQTAITNLYIGLFNRAPDASGLQFWAQALADGAPLSAITGSFLGSPESQAIYTPAQTSAQFVTSFYQTVFGRAPDTSGLAFWTNALNDAGGTGSAAAKALLVSQIVSIVSTPLTTKPAGLSDTQYAETVKDRDTFSKKVAVGIDFAVVQKSNDLTAAKTLVAAVTTPVVPTAPATPAVLDQVIALTIADETKTGGAGNDTFNAPMISNVQTLNNNDILDGGAGTDTLNAELRTSSFVTPTLTSIEIVKVKVVSSNGGLSLANATGVTNAGFDGSTTDGTLLNVGTAGLSVSNQTASASFSGITAPVLSLSLKTVGAVGSPTTVYLTHYSDTTGGKSVTHNIVASDAFVNFDYRTGANAVTAVTVAATGTNKLTLAASDAGTVTSLSLTGTGSVDFSGRALSALTSFADTGSGNVTLTTTNATVGVLDITTGAGSDTIVAHGASIKTLNTGAGNDVVTLNSAGLSATAVVNLGAGDDRITLAFGSVSGAVVNGGDGNDTIITGAVTQAAPATTETVTMTGVTFLLSGQSYTIAGLTFTPNGIISQTDLLETFASLAVGATTGAASGIGTYSGTLTGYSTGAVTGNSVLFSATSIGDKQDLTSSGTGAAAASIVVTHQGGAVLGTVDTLTGGAGNDTFSFGTADVNTRAGAVTAIITDFATGIDKIQMLSGPYFSGNAGTTFVKAGAVAVDLGTLLAAAATALAGNVQYYVGQIGTGVNADSYLVTDVNANGYTNVIKLLGVAAVDGVGIAATDILATPS